MGRNAVAAIGIASVIHQIAIHSVDDKIECADWDKLSKGPISIKITNVKGPSIKPIFFCILLIWARRMVWDDIPLIFNFYPIKGKITKSISNGSRQIKLTL